MMNKRQRKKYAKKREADLNGWFTVSFGDRRHSQNKQCRLWLKQVVRKIRVKILEDNVFKLYP